MKKSTPPPPQMPEFTDTVNEKNFPIVGIGASAGGLEALEGFFDKMPADGNIAFVVIQHLSPKHKSIMGDLLQKHTTMPVVEITDGLTLQPNHIYLNPPDKNVVIVNRRLQLLEPVKAHGVNLPIDTFFRSLADDQGEHAICIVLSGTGTDGTLGLKAVKGAGGMTMVQAEAQARYDGMPRSAIDTGQVDFVLPVEQMSAELTKYLQHPYIEGLGKVSIAEPQFQNHAQKIFALIRAARGHDFSNYKQSTLRRRIERRLALHQIKSIEDYLRYLQQTPAEVETLFKEMLIGVTSFFRDPEAFQVIADQVFPKILSRKPPDQPIRIWAPGCATGEEAYSLAILLTETMEQLKTHLPAQVFASDLDAKAIEIARIGVYPDSIAADVSQERLQRFFIKEGNAYRVKKQIRDMVVFAEQNLVKDPPFSKLDMLCCRNLLIYMEPVLQKKLLPLFHYTLLPGGVLFLGSSESIGEFTNLFTPLQSKWKIFARRDVGSMDARMQPVPAFFDHRPSGQESPSKRAPTPMNLRQLMEKIALEQYTMPCLLLNDRLEILYAIGPVDRYLQLRPGEPSFSVVQLAREGLRYKLSAVLRQAVEQRQPAVEKGVVVKQNGEYRTVNVTVRPLSEPASPPGLLLAVFEETLAGKRSRKKKTPPPDEPGDPRIKSLEQELQSTKEYLQTTIEELETSNEELKSTNEELQSVNEELQSTNEELETSKEELQSTNEELVTVNSELQHKVEELSRANNDINNLLASTDIGVIFLDNTLRIKRFTPAMTHIFNLIATDVGRPLGDITTKLEYDRLDQDAKHVLDTLNHKALDLLTTEGVWFSLRIAPYRTLENVIDGVVITFVDVTELKQTHEIQRNARLYAESIVATVRQPLLILDADLTVRTANKAFYRTFQTLPADTERQRIYDLGNGQWDIPKLRELLEHIIPQNENFEDYEVEHIFPSIGRRKMLLNARRIEQAGDQPHLILLAIEDVTGKE